ncbi:MAG: CopD family protein [Candidatus Sericytochromatia bacterium]
MYLALKSLHLLSVIVWFSGMIWMPQLLARQQESPSVEVRSAFGDLARWLMRLVISPAMIVTLVLGTALLVMQHAWLQNGWMHVKLLLVVALTGYHGFLAATRRKLAEGTSKITAVQLRRIGVLPLLALALVVGLVIIKPF